MAYFFIAVQQEFIFNLLNHMNHLITKSFSVVILLSLLASACSREARRIKERPDDIIATQACPTLYSSIMSQFPEDRDNEASQALLFNESAEKHVILKEESEVYVSFISEGAGYSNSFGWFSYPQTSPPASIEDVEKHILFPNVSGRILNQGDMLKLQDEKFPAGTVIGFFLIVAGWDQGSINYEKPMLFTAYHLNPGGQQQHILFKQKDCGDVVLAFEDRLLHEKSDADFNDIIFTVTDNTESLEVTKFNLTAMVQM